MTGCRVSAFACALLLVNFSGGAGFTGYQSIHTEVCQYETFESRCDVNDIVVMERATYGRMRLGRCVKTDFGFIGCDVDVLPVLDTACSGRRGCQFTVIEPNFPNRPPCNNEFKNHLELEYICVDAATFDASTCVLSTQRQQGVLPSTFTGETLCGTQIMPWVISVHEYQTITIELMDFSVMSARAEGEGQQYQTQNCYATISEPGLARQISACACGERSCHVSSSRGHTVNVVMRPTGHHNFLLLYRGVGCRPLKPREGMWMTRRGDTVDAGCRASGRTWQLRCVDTSWVGVLGNCTRVVQRQEETTQERHVKGYALPTLQIIMVLISVAVSTSVAIVCVGVFCVRRSFRGQHVAVSQHDPRVVLDRVRQVPPNDSKGVSFPTAMRTSFPPPETDYACTSHECPHECPYDWAYHGTPDCCRSSGEVTMKPYIVPSDCL